MRDEHFRRFLESSHVGPGGRPLSKRAAGDYVSRCRRVETLLGCDLDHVDGRPEHLAARIESKAGDIATAGIHSLQTAARSYIAFRQAVASR
ncbi:hypothetical protein [Sphingomonas sp. TZW2008]|uniref:hypothetical protein n=1 Tax=Sphingomonas sp. TZW2008 TaxID=1917973 RepID=UPI001181A563|nr:hypothetical protein [Sphingomonas sp. TZW2008]